MSKVKFTYFKLYFPSGLHINSGKSHYENTEELIHSDTILAAMQSVYAQWGKDPKELNDVVVSSMFPFVDGETETGFFFPKPFLPHVEENHAPKNFTKILKKIKWLDQNYFSQLACGNFSLEWNDIENEFLGKAKTSGFIKKETRLRTRVNRRNDEDTKPYYVDELHFKSNAGLYFLTLENDNVNIIETAIRMLQDIGLGTDKSIGKGHFVYKKGSLNMNLPDKANYVTNLGLYCPSNKDEWQKLSKGKHSYNLLNRGGWITQQEFATLRKNSVYMVEEGALLHNDSSAVTTMGELHNLAPEMAIKQGLTHPINRSGKSIFIPIKIV